MLTRHLNMVVDVILGHQPSDHQGLAVWLAKILY